MATIAGICRALASVVWSLCRMVARPPSIVLSTGSRHSEPIRLSRWSMLCLAWNVLGMIRVEVTRV